MKYPRTAAGYAQYLESEHWDRLRSAVLARDDHKCQKCGKRGWQVHHRFYRDDWEQGQPQDCLTLCRPCHESQHPEKVRVEVKLTVEIAPVWTTCPFASWKELSVARSLGHITRPEFLHWAKSFRPSLYAPKVRKSKRRAGSQMPQKLRKRVQNAAKTKGCTPWFYSPRKPRWVNRGTSSN